MTRLLIWGDLAPTGFGTVTTDLGRALIDGGHDPRFISLNEDVRDIPEPFASRLLLLDNPDGWLAAADGERALAYLDRLRALFVHGEDGWLPEATIIIGDPASLIRSNLISFLPERFPAYHYVPIEGVGLPPRWAALWARLVPVAMSEFGAGEIERLTGRRPPVVYHGVDQSVFRPATASAPLTFRTERDLRVLRSRNDAKRMFGLDPDRITILRADRNMPRKRFGAMFRIAGAVMARHPEVDLILHCATIDEGGNLDDLRSHLPPAIAARIRVTGYHDAGLVASRSILNALYNAADVYISTGAEGFGLTIAEAIAAGVPAVGLDFSSVPEVIGPAGVTVPVGTLIENIYAYWWATPDEPAFAAALEELVTHKARRRALGAQGPGHVAAHFSWVRAAAQFGDIIRTREELAA